MTISEDIKKLEQVKERYDGLKKELEDYFKVLNDAAETISKTITEMNMKLNPDWRPKTRVNTGVDYDEIAKEFFDRLMNGADITTDLIRNAYTDFQPWQCHTVMKKLRDMAGVDERKDGTRVVLFAKRLI
jgi:uncharacterized coiled-coil DUF342 family protein